MSDADHIIAAARTVTPAQIGRVMPILKVSGLDENMTRLLYLQGVMCFPESIETAIDFVRSSYAEGLAQVIESGEIEEDFSLGVELVRLLLNRSRHSELSADAASRSAKSPQKSGQDFSIHGGTIAAHMLLIPLAVFHHTGCRIGRNGALRVLVRWLSSDNQLIGAQKRNLQQVWDKYESVSHFWAAFHLLDGFPQNDVEMVGFVSLAEALRQEGEAYLPKRSKDSLLDVKRMWTAPRDFPRAIISLPEVYEHMRYSTEWLELATSSGTD